ncbi:MAG TPA: hypothetical protein VMS12_04865 [Thermoanaerobaculia bacterium]|nr:hypothetical protein [Thermoanaerobaculia bacterium]
MTKYRKIGAVVVAWVAVVTGLHFYMNADWTVFMNERLPLDKRKLNVAYIPVT